MRLIRAIVLVTTLLFALPGCGGQRFPADVDEVLGKTDEIELLSLDPEPRAPRTQEDFHGYPVLGKTRVKSAEDRKTLLKALYAGIRGNDGMVAGCFIPRHGIRAKHDGKTIELVICFQCMSMQVHHAGKMTSVLTTSKPTEVFNKLLTDAGVKLPRQAK